MGSVVGLPRAVSVPAAPSPGRQRGDTAYDVVLYGASGFVGQQTVAYFARHAPNELRWAIAGRDRGRLERVRRDAGVSVDVLVAEGRDGPALDDVASRTRVILSTAGPFARHGDALVDACVRFGTHYADITGETPWVRALIDRHHDQAAASGTRIVPCCGFDSVPSDLGALLVARHVQRAFGVSCEWVDAVYRMRGGVVNGGTIESAFALAEEAPSGDPGDPFLLNAPEERPADAAKHRDPRLPRRRADLGGWVAPFVMAPINTRVVRRSASLLTSWDEGYGPDFGYQEYLQLDGRLAAARAVGLALMLGVGRGVMRSPGLRRSIRQLLPAAGSGPAEEAMDGGWFSCQLVARAADGRRARATISDVGDPANRVTVKLVCESALALATGGDALPGGATRGGVLTPATALGLVLAERLRRSGMTVEVTSCA